MGLSDHNIMATYQQCQKKITTLSKINKKTTTNSMITDENQAMKTLTTKVDNYQNHQHLIIREGEKVQQQQHQQQERTCTGCIRKEIHFEPLLSCGTLEKPETKHDDLQ